MESLDLSPLTDDQLVELARLIAAEVARRGAAVHAAAQAATLDEAEKARVARQAVEAEAARIRAAERQRIAEEAAEAVRRAAGVTGDAETQRQQRDWARNKTIALMVRETLGPGWLCHVWRRDGETRVYLDLDGGSQKVSYYATGNGRRPPGSLDLTKVKAARKRVKAIVAYAAEIWRQHPQFDCDEAAEAALAAEPYPAEYVAAQQGGTA